jgi:hypothetical protein
MKIKIRFLSCMMLAMLVTNAFAASPQRIPGWHDGEIVFFLLTNENVLGADKPAIRDHVANPLYLFGPPGNQPQADVLSFVPGVPGYSPWWRVVNVVVLDGRDVTTDPFTSEAELLLAEDAGDVLLIETDFIFICQVVSK